MDELVIVFLAGFAASLVDGALGMGFGPTSSSILLGSGLSPAAISTTVNLAKVATGVTAAIAHWRFDNIDRRLVRQLALPGSLGALLGVTVLASVDGDRLKPVLAVLLMIMAVRILFRFSRPIQAASPDDAREDGRGDPAAERGTAAVAATGGVTNGLVGAWGPVVTPFLLHRGVTPRYAVGSVNTAEVAVATVASGSLLASVGGGGIDLAIVVAMLVGGVLAAPFAAWAIRFLPARALGIAVAALLLVTNIRELTTSPGLGAVRWLAYGLVILACGWAVRRPRGHRKSSPSMAGSHRG
ncbi:MAG TPA: sulfite exporter TauE/SafE family protein [Acidimicrobiales bacterium]|nr:sulfite exporter TauE/SafE family protein [Acidimicrobiales bacterium]